MTEEKLREVVVVEGLRSPFIRSGGSLSHLLPHDLGRLVVSELVRTSGIDKNLIEQVVMGTVLADPKAPNLAREVLLGCSLPMKASAYTVSMACISSNMASATVFDQIKLGRCDVAIAGGAECLSDFPIRLSKKIRQSLIRLQKAKGPKDYFKEIKNLSLKDLAPDVPSITEFSTGLTMGQSCERLGKRIGITRAESDAIAEHSHTQALKAWKEGSYEGQVANFEFAPDFKSVKKDDGPRETNQETLAKLKPSFDKKYGQITAGNASFLCDGASACLMMEKETALKLGFKPKATIIDYAVIGTEPLDDLLLGPAWVISELLKRHQLSVEDIGVFEIHEAFATQVAANLKVMASQELSQKFLGVDAIGEIPLSKLNLLGGSLALGHPFGATGTRLLQNASHRLQKEGARYAILSGCAAGGHGFAMLLKNPQDKEL